MDFLLPFLLPIFNFLISFFVFHKTRKEIQSGIPGAWLGYFPTLWLATLFFIDMKQAITPEKHELVFNPIFDIFFWILCWGTITYFFYLIIRIFSGHGRGPKRPRSA